MQMGFPEVRDLTDAQRAAESLYPRHDATVYNAQQAIAWVIAFLRDSRSYRDIDVTRLSMLAQHVTKACCIEEVDAELPTNSGVLAYMGVLYGKIHSDAIRAEIEYKRRMLAARGVVRRELVASAGTSRVTEGQVEERIAAMLLAGELSEVSEAEREYAALDGMERAFKILVDAYGTRARALQSLAYRGREVDLS